MHRYCMPTFYRCYPSTVHLPLMAMRSLCWLLAQIETFLDSIRPFLFSTNRLQVQEMACLFLKWRGCLHVQRLMHVNVFFFYLSVADPSQDLFSALYTRNNRNSIISCHQFQLRFPFRSPHRLASTVIVINGWVPHSSDLHFFCIAFFQNLGLFSLTSLFIRLITTAWVGPPIPQQIGLPY